MHTGTLATLLILILAPGTRGAAPRSRFEGFSGSAPRPVTRGPEHEAQATGHESRETSHGPTGPLTLPEAMALALAGSPELGVFPYELRAADARALQAGLRPNPQLQFEIEEFGGRGERRGFAGAETTLQIGLPLELAGKRAKRGQVAALDKELVRWDYEMARLDLRREVAQAFVGVLAAQERLALTERLLELSQQAQAAAAQRVQAGKDSPVDQLRAEVALSASRIEQQQAQKALAAARHRLAATWGGRTPLFEKAAGDFYETRAPAPWAEWTPAVAGTPDLKRWQTEQQKRQAALRLARAQRVPDITVGGGVRRFEQTDETALVFGLSVPLPLFDRNQGGVLEATAELAKTQRQYDAAQVRMLAALSEATSALAAAHEEIAILKGEVLPKARRVFDAAQQGYAQGKFDYLHLLEAQRTLFGTQAQYVDALATYHRTRADVERLIGRTQTVLQGDIQ